MAKDSTVAADSGRNFAYKNFAENLMTLATRGTTIAQTCRDLNINRQQFNKYLSGSVLPNAETMERLTQHFRIDVVALFNSPDIFLESNLQSSTTYSKRESVWHRRLESIIGSMRAEKQAVGLTEGVYHHYFPWILDASQCVRGIMIVTKRDGFTFFTRLSRYYLPDDKRRRWRTIVVDGVAVRENNRLVLVGQTRDDMLNSNMVHITTPQYRSSKKMFTGLVATCDPSGIPVTCRFATHRVGSNSNWRKFYRKCGLVPFDDPSLPSELQALTEPGFNSTNGILYPADAVSSWSSI